MIKRLLIAVFGFLVIVIALGAVKVAQIKGMPAHEVPVLGVSSTEARTEVWHPTLSAIGSIAPVQGVSLSTEVEGTVIKLGFENGQLVHAGDLLIELDSTVEQAQLKSAESQLVLAKLQANRSQELLNKQTISQAELDQATAQLNSAEASVAGLQATIAKKHLTAPFDGRVGIRTVNLGQFVTRGQALVPLEKLDQLYVNFTLPERDIAKVKSGETVRLQVDAYPDRKFEGKVNAVSPEVNVSTRNIAVQALLDNPDELLRSGMFARVAVEMPDTQPLVVVPETAIAYAAYGNSVFIVEQIKGKDGKEFLGVRQQFVTLGDKRGDLVAVLDGVKAGETVVSAGVFKLRNGLPVVINNAAQPSDSANPHPANS
jgi:membrane fusion protein, multidrug efflux system